MQSLKEKKSVQVNGNKTAQMCELSQNNCRRGGGNVRRTSVWSHENSLTVFTLYEFNSQKILQQGKIELHSP